MEIAVVHYQNLTNGMYVLKKDDTCIVMETFDVGAFRVGDAISGYFHQCGEAHLLNILTNKWVMVNICHINCSEESAMQKLNHPHKL